MTEATDVRNEDGKAQVLWSNGVAAVRSKVMEVWDCLRLWSSRKDVDIAPKVQLGLDKKG